MLAAASIVEARIQAFLHLEEAPVLPGEGSCRPGNRFWLFLCAHCVLQTASGEQESVSQAGLMCGHALEVGVQMRSGVVLCVQVGTAAVEVHLAAFN